jgi:hypothetical protein
MSELHQAFHRALDDIVEEPDEHGDWGRVVTDADRGTRRAWVLRIAVVGVAAVVAVGAALVSPFEDERPTGVIDRALAAIGDGPVIHLVTRGDWGGTTVDLSTGELTPVHAETEVWYDPARGVHYVSRFGGNVTTESVRPPDQLSEVEEAAYAALANRYRDELKSGKAKVVARGRVGDRQVLWIRVRSQWFPDAGDGREHLFAEEVAVDRTTYEPVYMRSTHDGRPVPGAGQLILKLETLAAGEGDFTADPAHERRPVTFGGAELGRHLSRDELAQALDGRAVWLGPAHAGKPLAESRIQLFKSRTDPDAEWDVVEGVSLFYGSFRPRRGGIRIRDDEKPFVQILQGTTPAPMWRGSELAADVAEGSVLVDAGGTGFLRRDGILVSVSSPEVRDVISAAAALRRVGEAPPAASGIDYDRIARLIGRRELVRVEGAAPVKPRSLFPRNARPLQSALSKGVKVTTYTGLAARFDTRAMDPELQRQLPERVNGRCFGLHGDVAGTGAGGWIPRNGVRAVVQIPHVRPPGLRPRRPISRRLDACEIGASFGRNWLPRFDWHGLVEIPLTERGRRFFEERAAAIELGHFVRNGMRKRARAAMKRGAPAPPAASLRDPARPYIRVSAGGDRFTASLTASTGRRFFVEIERGRIARTNARRLAFIR